MRRQAGQFLPDSTEGEAHALLRFRCRHQPRLSDRERDEETAVNITYLADHEEVIPILTKWFYQEWSALYPGKTIEDVRAAIGERTNRDRIPVALVAFGRATLVGTVCLKTYDMDTRADLSPWLAGLYVDAPWRGKGIGTALVRAIEGKAKDLGIRRLHLYTPSAESFYSRMAWRATGTTVYHGTTVTIMEKEMRAASKGIVGQDSIPDSLPTP